MHDREIVNRCDDSVVAAVGGATLFFRRSRGYVPESVAVPAGKGAPAVLGIGGEVKNTFCLLAEGEAYLSQHIGEVDTLEGRESLLGCINSFCRLTGIKPELITADLHPGYRSSSLADELAKELGIRRHPGVQHHHAHLASCMAENGLEGEVIGIILDGTGYGPDGRLWGFEIARGSYRRYRREFYLAYVPLPGGERAVREPWRTAAAYLIAFLGERGKKAAGNFFADRRRELAVVEKMLAAGINSPRLPAAGAFLTRRRPFWVYAWRVPMKVRPPPFWKTSFPGARPKPRIPAYPTFPAFPRRFGPTPSPSGGRQSTRTRSGSLN